jgi:hypothetical protein
VTSQIASTFHSYGRRRSAYHPGGTVNESVAEEEDTLLLAEGSRATVTARFDPSLRPVPGERMRLGVEPCKAHLFDMKIGDALA